MVEKALGALPIPIGRDVDTFQSLAMRSGLGQIIGMEHLIVIDPAICNGRPVVKGTRITVQTIMEFLAAGDSVDDVLQSYPTLTREQVLACASSH